MPRYIPPKIEDIGLENYLNTNYGAKGGFNEFEKHYKLGEPNTIIANAFNVDRRTIKNWIKI